MDTDTHGTNDYVPTWFDQMRGSSQSTPYWEPLVSDSIVRFILAACERLKQDTHVFVCVVETLERYMNVKITMGAPVPEQDMLLVAICGVFLCSKCAGGQSDLRASYIQEYMYRTFSTRYPIKAITAQEFDIFRTLHGSFPLYTLIDDLNILLEKYVTSTLCLKADLHELCTAVLLMYYVFRNRIFAELKGTYQKTSKGFYAFTQCVRQRLYFPSGILLCALKLTKCRYFLDLEKVGKDLGRFTEVHEDHLHFLCDIICDVVVNDDAE